MNWSFVAIDCACAALNDVLLAAPPVALTGFVVLDAAKYAHPQFVTC